MLTLTDCDGNSYTPEEDPITVREDRDTEAIWVCLPTSVQELGLIITVDGGECKLRQCLMVLGRLLQLF